MSLDDGTAMVTVGDACMQARLRVKDKLIPAEDDVPPRLFTGLLLREPDPMEVRFPLDDAYVLPCTKRSGHRDDTGRCQTVQRGTPAYWEDGSRAGTVRRLWDVSHHHPDPSPQPGTDRLCYRVYLDEKVCVDPQYVYEQRADGTITPIASAGPPGSPPAPDPPDWLPRP